MLIIKTTFCIQLCTYTINMIISQAEKNNVVFLHPTETDGGGKYSYQPRASIIPKTTSQICLKLFSLSASSLG